MAVLDYSSTVGPNGTDPIVVFVWYLLPTVVTVPPLGIPSNALVIRLLLAKPGVCSTSEVFTLNLALFNLLFCFAFLIEYGVFLFNRTTEAANFLSLGLTQAGGPMLLSLLALDGYLAVCHPLAFLRLKEPKLRPLLCVAVSAVTAACCALGKISSKAKWDLIMAILCGALLIISSCNARMLGSLRKSGPGGKAVHPVKKRAFKLVLTALLVVVLHYVPPVVEYVLRQHVGYLRPFSILTVVNHTLLSWGSLTQPLSYLVRTKQLPKARCHQNPPAQGTQSG
ncbi:allatostatin-A receptor-like [Brachionichthys hirsutus]|uniref:allatostatin-A receptor-like n=1 Tax=Brachionichthys hirsutus TaxID=412623 RepID=UPI003604D91C